MSLFNASFKFKTSYFFSLPVLILLLFIHISIVHSAQVTLAWDPNTEQDLSGYKIYYGTSSSNYTMGVDAGKNTTYTLSGLGNGITYYIASTAYDTEGYESDFSNQLSFTTPSECTYSISPTSQSFIASGGAGTVNVTTQSNCIWTATSNVSWLVITSNSSVTGNGVVNYSVLANTDVSSRTGTLTIAGQSFTVTQSGVAQYTLSIVKAGTGSGTVTNNPTGTTFNANTVVTLTAAPDANSIFAGWSGGCSGTSLTSTVTMNANTSVTATFTLKTYTITASAGANGSISPSGAVTVNHGANQTFSITPNTGYNIADVKVDGASVGKVTSYTFTNVTANHTLDASFSAIASYTLTITKAGTGSGTVTSNPTGTTFNANTVVTLTAAPDSNSTFAGWSGGCSGTSLTSTVTMNANTSVTATFTLKTYTITASAGANGSISPSGAVTINHGASQNFNITPNIGYSIADVRVDGASVGKLSSYTFSNIIGNHSIEASFVLNTYTITSSAGANGSISPPEAVTVNYGANQTFTILPNTGYYVADVKVDGLSMGQVNSYTVNNVTGNHTIAASFTTPDSGQLPSEIVHLNFEGRRGKIALDSSGNNNNGTIYGATYTTSSAVNSYALSFDGYNDYVVVKNSESISSIKSSNISVALWVKHMKNTSSAYRGIIQGPYGDGYNSGFRILDYSNKPLLQINFGDSLPIRILGNLFTSGKWCHIVFTYDHQNIKLYQDGKLIQTVPQTRNINWDTNNTNLYIGLAQWYFKGEIDNLIVYNYALSLSEVQELISQKR
jgi:hypothetical protein